MSRKRIFLGMPCYGTVAPDVLEDFGRFLFHCGRRLPQYDFFLGIRTKAEQFRARNSLVEAAQSMNCDYLLMLDDDMIVNTAQTSGTSDSYDFIDRLIAHDKDLIGVLYYQRMGACAPVLMTKAGEKGYRFLRDDEITHGLQKVDVAGGGCLLIKMRVFDRLTYPYFSPEYEYGTDVQLCRKATDAGFEVWADTSIELGHVRNERVIITSRNRAQFQMADTFPGDVTQQFVASDVYTSLEQDASSYTGYADLAEMTQHAQAFMQERKTFNGPNVEWYRQFSKERIARQVWFNTLSPQKRQMTEFILSAVNHQKPLEILDFGCGIGIPAYTLAQKGHQVTACDLDGTGTLDFLAWRAAQNRVPLTIHRAQGKPAFGAKTFDVIIAMDCLEHIEDWRGMLAHLVSHLKIGGALFANNAILDDTSHPEHYDLKPRDFLQACAGLDLLPINQMTYEKRAVRVEMPDGQTACAVA